MHFNFTVKQVVTTYMNYSRVLVQVMCKDLLALFFTVDLLSEQNLDVHCLPAQ